MDQEAGGPKQEAGGPEQEALHPVLTAFPRFQRVPRNSTHSGVTKFPGPAVPGVKGAQGSQGSQASLPGLLVVVGPHVLVWAAATSGETVLEMVWVC